MPTAIIWGAVGIVINVSFPLSLMGIVLNETFCVAQAAARHFTCFDVIESQLGQVAGTLETLPRHDLIFGEHDKMQKLILKSYISFLQFWSRVYREIQRSSTCSF